ncbi:MAG: hypothetical protein M1120_03795 [Patescibacteria group bacterium]|nr:hypothetical protein [Patescibacteria group bacterium]
MKRIFLFGGFFILFSVFCFLFSVIVLADSQSALTNYNTQYDLYRQNYNSYLTSKNKWLTYQTMTSNQEALTNGKIFLKQRVVVVLAYLDLLRNRVNESDGLNQDDKNLLLSKINVEESWLNDHLTKYDSAATLNDLQQLSGQFEDRYTGVIQYVALNTAGEVISAKEKVLNIRLTDIINRLDALIPEVANSGQDTSVASRWLLSAKNKNELASSKQDETQSALNSLRGQNPGTLYGQGLFSLSESNQYLIEAASYLNEVLKNITGK